MLIKDGQEQAVESRIITTTRNLRLQEKTSRNEENCTITVSNRRLYHHVANGFMCESLRFQWLSDPVITTLWEKVANTRNSVVVH